MPGNNTFPGGIPFGAAESQPADDLIVNVLRIINARTFQDAFSPTNPAETPFSIRMHSVHDRDFAGLTIPPDEPTLTSVMWHLDGIHTSQFFWLDPTGNRVQVDGVAVVYYRPDLLDREEPSIRVFFDEVSLWSQLGINLAPRPLAHVIPSAEGGSLVDEPVV